MERCTKIPKMDYKTIQKNIIDPVVIAPRSVGTRKCDCASSGKTDCIEDCKNAKRPIWTKSEEEFTICPVECTTANYCFGEKNCGIIVLLEEQHIKNCYPHKQGDGAGNALCTTTEIPNGVLIGQYVGVLTKEGNQSPTNYYIAELGSPDHKDGNSDLLLDAEKSGNLTRYINHSCALNCV